MTLSGRAEDVAVTATGVAGNDPRQGDGPAVQSEGDAPPGVLWDRATVEFVAWRSGDRGALDRLVRLVTPMLWHLARAYRLDQQTAEDVVQGTLVAMVRYADRIEDPQALIRWLTVTARRDAWRSARATQRVETVEDAVLDLRAGAADSPEVQVLTAQRDRALWGAVGRLSERCQRLLRIVAFYDRPNYTQLSQDLRMPVGSIGPTRGRCLEKLKNLIGTDPEWRRA
jgi:RNA polymerase sigma factor (sigma-70 family)